MNNFPEDKQAGDYLHSGAKAVLSAIPEAGRPLVTIFETIFSPPLEKRKIEWLNKLAATVDELYQKNGDLTPEKLANNPEFVSFYLQASNIALRTHNEEKLKALNTAVKNSVLLKEFDESKKMVFLRIIDQMTPLHFKIFHFLAFPEKYIETLNSKLSPNTYRDWNSLSNIWNELNPEVRSDNPLVDVIVNDLKNYGLVPFGKFREAKMETLVFGFGRDFINFINE